MAGAGLSGVLLGAFLTLASTVCFRLWQYERERWTGRVDWFCDALEEAANLGVEYWIEAGNGDERGIDRRREVQILGFQMKLDGMLETFIDKLHRNDANIVRALFERFRDELTGGEFQSMVVKADHERARTVQMHASDLLVGMRKAVDNRLKILPRRYPVEGLP